MSSLLKSTLHNSIAESVMNEIQNQSSRYYYFLGKTLAWADDAAPPLPIDSFDYELQTRNEIITTKQIKPTDVAFVVPRRDWASGIIYDMYDDQYSDEVQGVNLVASGFGYSDPPNITISGGGVGATAVASLSDGIVTNITLTSRGRGYTSIPIVTISGGGGEGATATAVVTIAPSGSQLLENTNSYVLTDDFNVYKCLDNNNSAISTYKPVGTVVDPVNMPDGYMWKYLYSIPIALRNKFLTEEYMPVVNALRQQFYSNGEILNVIINSSGQDYTFANISVQGDGYRIGDPFLVQNVTINNQGSGYIAGATVNIEPPFQGSNPWQDGIGVLLGQKVSFNFNIYEATVSGTMASPAPTHKSGIVANGTAALKYIGTQVTGTVTISANKITGVVLNGSILEIQMTDGGNGYTSAPTISLIGGGGSGFVGQALTSGISVSRVYISDSGINYTSLPVVQFGNLWTTTTAYTLGQQVYFSDRLYTVTTAGTTGSSSPTHTTVATPVTAGAFVVGFKYKIITLGSTTQLQWNTAAGTTGVSYDVGSSFTAATVGSGSGTATTTSATNGSTILTWVGNPATGTAALKYGAGYSALPALTFSASQGLGATGYTVGVKSEAKLVPILSDGNIVGVQIDDGGIGYTYANITVSGDGNFASIEADLSPGDIATLQANTELLTPDGRIMAYSITSGGTGYGFATVTIDGDGTGASAIAICENGAVKKITVIGYGTGYRWANVTISGTGVGAQARPVRAPYGGHGKDPIKGMFSRSIMFYSNISKDTNQGFAVNNDFRQIGIIKNPRQFGVSTAFKSSLGSGCYLITGNIDVSQFSQDMLLTLGEIGGRRFRIVAVTTTGALLQSLDNAVPTVGAVFLNSASNTFSAAGVTAPNTDKYSGSLLFIDNKQAFTPTADQNVTLRTVITF